MVCGKFFIELGIWCRVYDRVVIKFRGVDVDINFDVSDYEDDFK